LTADKKIPLTPPTISVIIAAFSMQRWQNLHDAVSSVSAQTIAPFEIIVVIDHNPALLDRALREFKGVKVLANKHCQGASGARNTGVTASHGEIVAFLDDDACASATWLESLVQHFTDVGVVGVGGRLDPIWATSRPRWFPIEFDWAVGTSYLGMPLGAEVVRNVWTNNMAIRRRAFDKVGGFRPDFGKVGTKSRPEDTDLCLRVAEANGGVWIYEPEAAAGHQVPVERTTIRYFIHRCFNEGWGKAALSALNGAAASTSTERSYTTHILPAGIKRELRDFASGNPSGLLRSFAIVMGLASAMIGFGLWHVSSVPRSVRWSRRSVASAKDEGLMT
jgi:cellulose synthase/poly-beta-1,6-N-acetylglucosamine synthase-like glycosyltransferase